MVRPGLGARRARRVGVDAARVERVEPRPLVGAVDRRAARRIARDDDPGHFLGELRDHVADRVAEFVADVARLRRARDGVRFELRHDVAVRRRRRRRGAPERRRQRQGDREPRSGGVEPRGERRRLGRGVRVRLLVRGGGVAKERRVVVVVVVSSRRELRLSRRGRRREDRLGRRRDDARLDDRRDPLCATVESRHVQRRRGVDRGLRGAVVRRGAVGRRPRSCAVVGAGERHGEVEGRRVARRRRERLARVARQERRRFGPRRADADRRDLGRLSAGVLGFAGDRRVVGRSGRRRVARERRGPEVDGRRRRRPAGEAQGETTRRERGL